LQREKAFSSALATSFAFATGSALGARAAGGDAVLDEKCEELGEEIVVGNGIAEGAKLIESRGEIGIRGAGLAKCTVAETESGVFRHRQVTTPAGTLLAATGYRLNSALPQSVGRSKLAKRIKDPETAIARFTQSEMRNPTSSI
jgi:hypothetical protein